MQSMGNYIKNNKLDFIKIKNFCVSKSTVKVKKQHTEWDEIFANLSSDKRLTSRKIFILITK
jgi:hypothetical protein